MVEGWFSGVAGMFIGFERAEGQAVVIVELGQE